jgi:hypothetical protein
MREIEDEFEVKLGRIGVCRARRAHLPSARRVAGNGQGWRQCEDRFFTLCWWIIRGHALGTVLAERGCPG